VDRPFNDLNEELNKLVGKYMAKGLELEFILAIMRAHADLLERVNFVESSAKMKRNG
jgi:uncharacterized protein YpiB (UPF0302 family)